MPPELITFSPIDGQELLRRAYTDQAEITRILQQARAAQKAWAAQSLDNRCIAVSTAVARFVANKSEIALAITRQMGRPLRYTPNEVAGFEERANHMIAIASQALVPIEIPKKDTLTRFIAREPVGVVFTIAPWNYPLLTAVNSIVPALVAGNSVILKHSDQTPLCAELMVQAFTESGLPPGVFQFIHATHDTVRRLIQSPEINYVSFTGSVPGGHAVEAAAAGRFIGLGLELGGNDPAYVRTDADLAQAVDTLVDGAYFNSGQSCCGIQRIYVAQNVYQEFVDRAVAPTGVVDDAIRKGASNLVDAGRFGKDQPGNAYVAPALLTHVNHDMAIMNEECFGPVVGIMPVQDDAQAIALMNDSPYGLTASVFTRDVQAALRIGGQVETGTFFMNRCDYLDPALAWTGVKNTGHGVSLSTLGYESVTQAKSYHLRSL